MCVNPAPRAAPSIPQTMDPVLVGTTGAAVLLLSLLSCATVLAGVALALRLRENARALAAGIGFSVGVMLLISLAELIPQAARAVGLGATAGTAGAGAALAWAAHVVIPHTHLVKERGIGEARLVRAAYLVALGLILHDVPEGFAMANAYVASPALGVLVALAIALHNVPEEFAMAVPLVMLRSKASLYGAAALSALAEPLGAVIGLAAVGVAPSLNAHFLALAAGAMLFVSVHELLPMARRYRHPGSFLWGLAFGALVYGLLAAGTAALTHVKHGFSAA
jgi:ZIP family zinc transporter